MTETSNIAETTLGILKSLKQSIDDDNGLVKADIYLAGILGKPGNPVLQARDDMGTLWQLVLWVEDR